MIVPEKFLAKFIFLLAVLNLFIGPAYSSSSSSIQFILIDLDALPFESQVSFLNYLNTNHSEKLIVDTSFSQEQRFELFRSIHPRYTPLRSLLYTSLEQVVDKSNTLYNLRFISSDNRQNLLEQLDPLNNQLNIIIYHGTLKSALELSEINQPLVFFLPSYSGSAFSHNNTYYVNLSLPVQNNPLRQINIHHFEAEYFLEEQWLKIEDYDSRLTLNQDLDSLAHNFSKLHNIDYLILYNENLLSSNWAVFNLEATVFTELVLTLSNFTAVECSNNTKKRKYYRIALTTDALKQMVNKRLINQLKFHTEISIEDVKF